MSTIYDNMGNDTEDKSALDEVFGRSANKYEEPVVIKNADPEMPVQKSCIPPIRHTRATTTG